MWLFKVKFEFKLNKIKKSALCSLKPHFFSFSLSLSFFFFCELDIEAVSSPLGFIFLIFSFCLFVCLFISPIHYYFFSTVQWRHEARGTILNILDKEHFRRGRKFYWMAVLKEGNFALKSTVNWNSGSE